MTSSELWNNYLNGDKKAFSALFTLLYPDLYGYGISFGFEKENVNDAIQEVFLKLFYKKGLQIEADKIKFYLLRSVKNRLIDLNRTAKPNSSLELLNQDFTIEITTEDNIIEQEEIKQIKARVQEILNQLTKHQKEIVYLRFIEEMEYEDIALMLDMKPQAVRGQVFKSLEKLRKLNKNEYFFILFIIQQQFSTY